jgi:hypothetical protein
MQEQESLSHSERKAEPRAAATSFEFQDVLSDFKEGDTASESAKLFERSIAYLKPEQRKLMADSLIKTERCSPEFAERFLADQAFRKRITKLQKNFAEHGERMDRLEEAEIFSSIMDAGSDDIGPLLKATDLTRMFSNLKPVSPEEMRRERVKDLQGGIEGLEEGKDKAELEAVMQEAFAEAGVRPGDWNGLYATPSALEAFVKHEPMQKEYEERVGGKLDALHRRIQLHWREREDGTRIPVLTAMQLARNPETGEVSRFGLEIESESYVNPKTGKQEHRRVAKEGVIVIDQSARNQQQGIKFLLDKMGLVKEYKLDAMEFKANIQIGSYVWARIADMDVSATARSFLSEEDLNGLGPEPWDEAATKRAKALVFRQHVLPAYSAHLREALSLMSAETRASHEEGFDQAFREIEKKASEGTLTMEELADFGKGVDAVGFSDEGEMVRAEDPRASQKGHLGKAALMGIPWQARIPLDRRSLSAVIDKLNKGRPLSTLLMKAGLYLLH